MQSTATSTLSTNLPISTNFFSSMPSFTPKLAPKSPLTLSLAPSLLTSCLYAICSNRRMALETCRESSWSYGRECCQRIRNGLLVNLNISMVIFVALNWMKGLMNPGANKERRTGTHTSSSLTPCDSSVQNFIIVHCSPSRPPCVVIFS